MLDDLRTGARGFARQPGFAVLAIITLALGIAANTAIFSVVNGVLLQPLPFPNPEEVVSIESSTGETSQSAPDFRDFVREQRSLVAIGASRSYVFSVSTASGSVALIDGAYVTPGYFDVFRAPALVGRTFTMDADRSAGGGRVVLSRSAAAKLAVAPDTLVGQTVRIDNTTHAVVGVMPDTFQQPEDHSAIWILTAGDVPPSPFSAPDDSREVRYFDAVARVRPELSRQAIAEDLNRVARDLDTRRTEEGEARDLRAVPLHERLVAPVRSAIVMVQAGVGLVLLIASVNISSLLIARTTGRQRELAVRAALGARPWRLIRQLLTESVLLGTAGGALGLLLGQWAVSALLRILPTNVPRTANIEVDGTVAVVTLIGAVLASVLFGALPALQASRANASSVLRAGGSRGSSGRSRTRSVLVVVEIALTTVVLVAAGLLVGSLTEMEAVDPGFRAEHALLANVAVPQTRYPDGASQTQLYRRLLEALSARPEFDEVALGFPSPLRGSQASGNVSVIGPSLLDTGERAFAHLNSVSPRFFAAMGIPIIAGRSFVEGDLDGPPVAVISAEAARRYWPDGDAVGRQFQFDLDSPEAPFVVVGISGDVHQNGVRVPAPPLVYFPFSQLPLPFTSVVVRTTIDEALARDAVAAALKHADPGLPAADYMTLSEVVYRALADARFRSFIFAVLGMVALLLAAVGVYSLVSYTVAQETRDIGIRLALGAAPRHVVRNVVGRGAVLGATGVCVGLAAAWFTARAFATFLFGVSTSDPLTFGGVGLALLGVSVLSSYVPARRALRIAPTVALRAE